MELRSGITKHSLKNTSTQPLKRRKPLPALQDIERDGMMNSIPNEILTKIFQYLPLEVRKNGKLVCSNWYDILTLRTFQKNEKIMCRNIYSCAEISTTLMAFRCPLYSLVFQDVNFTDYPSDFWKQRGGEIINLDIRGCIAGTESLLEMMMYCVNLTHWTIIPSSLNLQDSALMELLIEKMICLPNLINLKMSVIKPGKQWLSKLFRIFPKIRHLNFNEDMELENEGGFLLNDQPRLMRKSIPVSYLPFDLQQTANGLFDGILSCKMLQEFHMSYEYIDDTSSFQLENILAFVSKQTMLKKTSMRFTSCVVGTNVGRFKMDLMHILLNNCLDLQVVYIVHTGIMTETDKFVLNFTLVRKLVQSKLEILEIEDKCLELDTDFVTWPALENYNLKFLRLTLSNSEDSSFLQIFRGLEHWKIYSKINNRILQEMSQYQTKLVSLDIRIDMTDDVELSSKFLSVSKFFNLRYLKMVAATQGQEFLLNLPNLEYFSLSYSSLKHDKYIGRLFNTIATSYPKLKYLKVDCDNLRVSKSSVVKLCTSLKQLQFLLLEYGISIKKFSDKELQDLFQLTQSLRVVSLGRVQTPGQPSFRTTRTVGMYDRSRNKLFQAADPANHRFRFNSNEMDFYGFAI